MEIVEGPQGPQGLQGPPGAQLTPEQLKEFWSLFREQMHLANRRSKDILIRPSRPGDFRLGWSPIYFEHLGFWERRKRRARQFFYDLTHRRTCMCSKCNQVVDNTGWHRWTFGTSYYFPDHCPHCGS